MNNTLALTVLVNATSIRATSIFLELTLRFLFISAKIMINLFILNVKHGSIYIGLLWYNLEKDCQHVVKEILFWIFVVTSQSTQLNVNLLVNKLINYLEVHW